ncbi:MAG: aspartate carbamoyltransferase regulatory subunit [Nanoarchaeota archaeon]|nr:aspartate carbamoyltransferase regulatory subunit [Nanoarchaeota archaeon]MBU1703876.1 aspartate carbamoyltransferase regulatory subunit [Nanoarchaeota archaeon]
MAGKEFTISAIPEGTVIDHITAKNTFKVAQMLKLGDHKDVVNVATNLPSRKMGVKGLIKIAKRELTKDEVNKVALLTPDATVSIIKDFEVIKKFKLQLPEAIPNIIKCSNPKCITNAESVPTRFTVMTADPLKVRCDYCERAMWGDEIKFR